MGQVRARIERAWYRPRSAIVESLFQCQVLIRQSRSGEVEAVELPSCNGDIRWQLSLAKATQTASPLLAPPDLAVFVGSMTLDFESTTFVDGGSEQGFEPAGRTLAMADSTPTR